MQKALKFENTLWSEWSKSNDQATFFINSIVPSSITFYGATTSHNAFMKTETDFMNRWPDRLYVPEPSTVSITCNDPVGACHISGIVDWDDKSLSRDSRSIGRANFDFQIIDETSNDQDHFMLISESGSVINRTSGTIESLSNQPALQVPTEEQTAPNNPGDMSTGQVGIPRQQGPTTVNLINESGVMKVPVEINGVIQLEFVIDSGASDVSIPADVVLTLIRTGTIQNSDFLGAQTYEMADGTTVPSENFNIRSLKVGDQTLFNVTGSIANVNGELLLGQSFLSRFNSWSIDNSKKVLQLN